MKVTHSSLDLSSFYSATEVSVETTQMRLQAVMPAGEQPSPLGDSGAPAETVSRTVEDEVNVSERARTLLAERLQVDVDAPLTALEDLEHRLLCLLFEVVTGRSLDVCTPRELADIFFGDRARSGERRARPRGDRPPERLRHGQPPSGQQARGQWALEVDYYRAFRETEKLRFEAQGVVKTADGKELEIDLALNMDREWFEEQHIEIQGRGELIDPLVINFDAPATSLTSDSFEFDIDADGRVDQVAMLGQGSGYLALDSNGDGVINDGSELFGPSTNNGFQELAAYDHDGNGWIDEGDDVYSGLRLWVSNGKGQMKLMGLGAAGVGAIYLGHLETSFELNDSQNQQLGQVKRTGVFLKEDGVAGTIQEIDLVA